MLSYITLVIIHSQQCQNLLSIKVFLLISQILPIMHRKM